MPEFCQSQPCPYQVYGRCTRCLSQLCFVHMGYQPPPRPGLNDMSFYSWWAETAAMTSDYQHVMEQIRAYWYQLPGMCTDCRVAAIKRQFPNAPAEAARIQQAQSDLAARRLDYVRRNWRAILDHHRRQRRRDDKHKIGFMNWIDVWHVGGRHLPSGSRYHDVHVEYTILTADNRVLEGGKLVPFDPREINSFHWLYELANRYGLLPRE